MGCRVTVALCAAVAAAAGAAGSGSKNVLPQQAATAAPLDWLDMLGGGAIQGVSSVLVEPLSVRVVPA
jgi:hypothetical protein